jgi:hypothetical protein
MPFVCSKIRQYLADSTIPGPDINAKFRKVVTKAAKHYFLHDRKQHRGIIREVCDTYDARRNALKESHNGTTHHGVENTLIYLCS